MIALGVGLSLIGVARNGDDEFLFLWALPTVFADSIPIVVGGAIVRTCRSAATTQPSATEVACDDSRVVGLSASTVEQQSLRHGGMSEVTLRSLVKPNYP